MRVLLLSDPNSAHTIKWANILSEKGLEVFVWGLSHYNPEDYNKKIEVITVGVKSHKLDRSFSSGRKIVYLSSFLDLKRYIRKINPQIVHAHYATSYGLLGVMSQFRPLIISVWGSDVFNFPNYSFLHRKVFKYIINQADIILSTSEVMKKEVQKYTSHRIEVTPFGVDMNIFYPASNNDNVITIGTIKLLEKIYGINYLIQAFKKIVDKYPNLPLRLLIVGKGTEEDYLKNLTKELLIEDLVDFTGYIHPGQIPEYHRKITIPIFLSIEESFGVSAVEAAACGKPVVATNVAGYSEIIENDLTGILVDPHSSDAAAGAIEKLILNPSLRESMGLKGQERVRKMYNLIDNADKMIRIYQELI